MVQIFWEGIAYEVFVEAPEVARWDEMAEASPEGEQAVVDLNNKILCTIAVVSFID